jgi:hypothetical protein
LGLAVRFVRAVIPGVTVKRITDPAISVLVLTVGIARRVASFVGTRGMRTDRKLLALQITNLVYALTHTGSSIELRAIAVAHIKHITGHPNCLLVMWHAVPTGV